MNIKEQSQQDRTIDLTSIGGIKFEESSHRYTNKNGVVYTGITTLLKRYEHHFDTELGATNSAIKEVIIEKFGEQSFNSLKKQLKEQEVQKIKQDKAIDSSLKNDLIKLTFGHTFLHTRLPSIKSKYPDIYEIILNAKERLKIEWAATSKEATDYGSLEHDKRERGIKEHGYFYDGKLFEYHPDKNITNVSLNDRIVIPECLVWNHKLKLGGLSDIFLFDKGTILVQDYKTNEKLEMESFMKKKMKGVCSGLMDCSYFHYSLQLRIYQEMALRIRPEFKKGNNLIIHTSSEKHNRKEDDLIPCHNVEIEVMNIFKELELAA